MCINQAIIIMKKIVVSIILFFIVIACMLFMNFRFDISKAKTYKLSEKTLNVLNGLENKINVIVFFQPDHPLFDMIKQLLATYKTKTDKLNITFVNPRADLAFSKQLAEKYDSGYRNGYLAALYDFAW